MWGTCPGPCPGHLDTAVWTGPSCGWRGTERGVPGDRRAGLCCDARSPGLRPGTDTTPAQRRAPASTAHSSRLLPHVSVPFPPCSGPNPQGPPSLPDTSRPEPKVRTHPHLWAQEAWTGCPCLFWTRVYPPNRRPAALEKPQVALIRTCLLQVKESLITDKMLFSSPKYKICELRERFLPNTT